MTAVIPIGFGSTYYHNMGGTVDTPLQHHLAGDDHENDEEQDADNTDAARQQQLQVKARMFASKPPWDVEQDPLIQVAASGSASLLLTRNGKVYTMGTIHGRVRPTPTRMVIQLPLKAVEIAAGRHFCLARMEGGLAVCSWGAGHFGQLGLGEANTATFVEQPTVIEGLLPHIIGSPIASIAAGFWHAMAVTQSGHVWSWGCNRSHQCGRKRPNNSNVAATPPTIISPQLVPFESANTQISKIACGRSHSVALDQKGAVYCWGASNYGQCGGGVPSRRGRGGIAPPQWVEALAKVQIVDIAAGDAHTMALTGGGRVFGWGCGAEGQLGTGACILLNAKPKLIGDLDFVAIEAGQEWKTQQKLDSSNGTEKTDCAGAVVAAGEAQYSPPASPHSLSHVPKIVSISACGNYSAAISSSGHLYTWGCNDVGNLGIPKPRPETLTFIEPGMPLPKTSTLRYLHTLSFDSSHNVALPQRVDSISSYSVMSVALSPTFMWCLGSPRTSDNNSEPVGRTLYEVQEAKRQKNMKLRRKSYDNNSVGLTASPDSTTQQTPPSGKDANVETSLLATQESPAEVPSEETGEELDLSQSQDSNSSAVVGSVGEESSPRHKSKKRFGPLKLMKRMASRSSSKGADSSGGDIGSSRTTTPVNQNGEGSERKGRRFF